MAVRALGVFDDLPQRRLPHRDTRRRKWRGVIFCDRSPVRSMRPPDGRAPCAPRAAPAPCGRGRDLERRCGGAPDRRDVDTAPTREPGRHALPEQDRQPEARAVIGPSRPERVRRNASSPRAWPSWAPRGDDGGIAQRRFFRASQGALETPRVHVEPKASVNLRQQRPDAERRSSARSVATKASPRRRVCGRRAARVSAAPGRRSPVA